MLDFIDYTALGLSTAVFVAVAIITWITKRYNIADGVGLIVLVALPIAAYGVARGYISKISTPGGWGAEFRNEASSTIEPARLVDEVSDIQIIEKAGIAAIQKYREDVQVGKPIAISIELGRPDYYSAEIIAEYVRAFITYDPQLTVIFVEQRNSISEGKRFVASTNGNSVIAASELVEYGSYFVNAIEEADLLSLRRYVVLTTNFVDASTTNSEALGRMTDDGVDSLIKVDELGKAVGVVRRDKIISQLQVNLAK